MTDLDDAVTEKATPRLPGELIRRALLGEVAVPPDSPLKLDSRGARLEGAIIEGGLNLSGHVFDRPIAFERCVFLGPIDLSDATLGRVSLSGSRAISIKAEAATIAGDLNLSGLRLENPGGVAFDGRGMRVGGSIRMQGGFFANGAVHLIDADIAGSLNCNNSTFKHPYRVTNEARERWNFDNHGAALNGTRAKIGGYVSLHGSHVEGVTAFPATNIGGNVFIVGTSLVSGEGQVGLNMASARVGGSLILSRAPAFEGALRLRGAHVESLGDDGSFWRDTATGAGRPQVALELDQFHYATFFDAPIVRTDASWRTRLQWIMAQRKELWTTDFCPQPFTQCAAVLRNMGDSHGARMILFERERLRLKAKNVGLFEKLGGHVMGVLAGYGYKSHYALYWALGVWLLGALVFGVADRLGEMRPADPHVLAEAHYQETLRPPTDYEPVKPALLSLDLLLPIVDIGQEQYWIPRDAGERAPDSSAAFPRLHHSLVPAVNWLFGGWLPKAYYYFEIAMGWLLVSIVIAGFSGLLGHAREE